MFKYKTINVNNYSIELRIKDIGAKDSFLFVHGFNSSRDFSLKVEELAKKFNTISFSLPGTKETPLKENEKISFELLTKIVNQIAKKVKNSRLHILGHSLGGAIVSYVDPKIVESYLLISPLHPYMVKYKPFTILSSITRKENTIASKIINSAIKALDKKSDRNFQIFTDKSSDWYPIMSHDLQNSVFFENLENNFLKIKSKSKILFGDKDIIISTKLLTDFVEDNNWNYDIIKSQHSPLIENTDSSFKFISEGIIYKKRFLWRLRKII